MLTYLQHVKERYGVGERICGWLGHPNFRPHLPVDADGNPMGGTNGYNCLCGVFWGSYRFYRLRQGLDEQGVTEWLSTTQFKAGWQAGYWAGRMKRDA